MRIEKTIKSLLERLFGSTEEDVNLPGYSYFAFISYTEVDEKWAAWLQWELEHYRIPTKVRKEHGELPSRVSPVFWYKNDLAGAHLSGAIKKELEKSKYLIVICSRSSANKEWVNDEVSFFKDALGRGDRIIPLVIDGEINSANPDMECLPLPIRNLPRDRELRCVDVRAYGKNRAIVNIVSTLLDIRFDVLWNRFRREQQRRWAMYATCISLMVLLFWGVWVYFLRTKYEYFVGVEDCNGIPTGILPVDKDVANRYYRLYRFESRSGLLRRVVYVDGGGNPQNHTNTEYADRPSQQILLYNNGELTGIECQDASSSTLYIMHLSKNRLAADLKDEDNNYAANFIISSTAVDQGMSVYEQSAYLDRFLKSPSKISRYVYERDGDGYITKKLFAKNNGDDDDISMDANGISGFEYERDSLHRVVAVRFLDNRQRIKSNHLGVAGKRYQYDQYGNLCEASYVDEQGKLKYNEYHWARFVDLYDENGYPVEERLYGTDDTPCVSVHGYHRVQVEYNQGTETFSYYDVQGDPTYTLPRGSYPGGFSKQTRFLNEQGQIVEIRFKDAKGDLCYNGERVAIQKCAYNHRGQITARRFYNVDDRPCANIYGFFCERTSYNEFGCLTEQAVYDIDEKPVQNHLGIHRLCMQYDDTGRRVSEAHAYNLANFPMYCPLFEGAAWIRFGYHGNSKRVSQISFYSNQNQPFETRYGAKVVLDRDANGAITSCSYYNSEDKLCSNANHCAIMRLEYNAMGQETNRRCYDEHDHPVQFSGVFHLSKSYTKAGQVETVCCYDTLQKLHIGPGGWAVQKFKYNNGAVSEHSVFGEKLENIEIKGVHKYVYEIDDCGNILSIKAFDKNLQPALQSDCNAHIARYIYDDKKRVIGTDYYDSEHTNPFLRIRKKLNVLGLPLEQTVYDSKGELVESPMNWGVAKMSMEYDSRGQLIHLCATDRNGNRMNASNGIAECKTVFQDNVYESLCLDADGKLVNNYEVNAPYAYMLVYKSDTGKPLYNEILRVSYGFGPESKIDTIRAAFCYGPLGESVKALRYADRIVEVLDQMRGESSSYFSFEEEYDDYIHIMDSIQHEVQLKYGMPVLYP